MMGHTHALSGLAAGAATLPVAPVHTFPEQLAWTAVWGGMAMLPDLDQKSSTVSDMWGWVTEAFSVVVGFLARGHRRGTHDLLVAPLAFGALAYAAAAASHWTAILAVAVAIGLALRACNFVIPGRTEETVVGNLVLSLGGAWLLAQHADVDSSWLPYAVAGGVLTHIAGDSLTTDGVPLPFSWISGKPTMYGLSLADTNTWLEHVAAAAFGAVAVWQLVANTALYAAIGLAA